MSKNVHFFLPFLPILGHGRQITANLISRPAEKIVANKIREDSLVNLECTGTRLEMELALHFKNFYQKIPKCYLLFAFFTVKSNECEFFSPVF